MGTRTFKLQEALMNCADPIREFAFYNGYNCPPTNGQKKSQSSSRGIPIDLVQVAGYEALEENGAHFRQNLSQSI